MVEMQNCQCHCRASFAAAVALLQSANALREGSAPVLPRAADGPLDSAPGARQPFNERDEELQSSSDSDQLETWGNDKAALNSAAPALGPLQIMKVTCCIYLPAQTLPTVQELVSCSSSPALLHATSWHSSSQKCRAFQEATAEELLQLALQGGEQLEPLRQWLKLQLQSSPRLAGLRAIAEELGEGHAFEVFVGLLNMQWPNCLIWRCIGVRLA